MGAAPSLAKFLRSMEDEELTDTIEEQVVRVTSHALTIVVLFDWRQAYHLDPQRIERIFTIAKLRYLEKERLKNGEAALDDSESLPSNATSTGLAAFASASSGPSPNASSVLLAKDMASMLPSGMEDHLSQTNANVPVPAAPMEDSPAINDSKDPINAIWSFEGHVLRELQPSEKNPQHNPQHANSASEGDDVASSARETDEDGYPILYGSCGRDKKYARCSVCYFRGLRCNSSHYCACCQRPVCIRPRKYPGEEHPKICWNVLHTDKDMVQRVEKKKRRRLQAVAMSSSVVISGAGASGDGTLKSDLRVAASAAALHASRSASLGANALAVTRSSLQDMTAGTTPPADAGGNKEVIDI